MTRAREIADLAGLLNADSTGASFEGSTTFDTSTLFIDGVNDRVGVGTTSPTKAFDLRGSFGIGNAVAVRGSIDPYVVNDSNGGLTLSSQTSSSLTEKVRLTDTGRVGIGTTSPDTLLHIKATDNAGVTLESTDGSRKWLIRNNQGTNDGLVLRNATAGTDVVIIDDGAGANSLVVDSAGNVALGGTDADVTLDMSAKNDAIHLPTGNTSQRPSAAEAGMFRYNSETSQFEGYTNAWGAIAGSGGGVDSAAVRNIFSVSGDLAYDSAIGQFSFDASTTFSADTFTGDDSTAAFTLSQTVNSENNLIVFNEGVFQNQSAYTLSGTTLTFDSAPALGNTIVAYQVKNAIFGNNLNLDRFSGDDSSVGFTLSLAPINENNTQVYIDGVYQQKDGYTTSGTTLTFDTAPPTGSTIEVMTMTQTDINTAKILQDGDLDTKIQVEESNDEDTIRFDTAGTERMVINSTGVGIGTSSPSVPLSVESSSTTLASFYQSTNAAEFVIKGAATNVLTLAGGTGDSLAFETGGTERMRIDTSGTLLVGGTNDNPAGANVTGHAFGASGYISTTRDGGFAAFLNRKTSDGEIVRFGKDGSEVGSIGADGGAIYIGNTAGEQFKFHNGSGGSFYPKTDNNNDLGASSNRFKDLYLSGGAYLGGTGSANYLDDYEEGTWTVSLTASVTGPTIASIDNTTGYYTKIGNLVYFHYYSSSIAITNAGSGFAKMSLPFAGTSGQYGLVNVTHSTCFDVAVDGGYTSSNESICVFTYPQPNTAAAGWTTGNPRYLMVQGVYRVP